MHIRVLIAAWTLLPMLALSQPVPVTQPGVAHIGGLYSFTKTDHLNEGADTIRSIGARCIKVALSLDTDNPTPKLYPFHSDWPTVKTLEELAATPYFRALFEKDFDTFILTTFRPGRPASYWRDRFTTEDEKAEEDCFAALTRYLLKTHAGSLKTFVLQNWEGDWALRGSFDPAVRPTATATASMIRWIAARQRGVERGRQDFASGTARVFHACEVNLVGQSMDKGAPGVTTDVLPQVTVDVVSYSAWDVSENPEKFGEALNWIARHKKPTEPFGRHGVYVGEFGAPESGRTPQQVLDRSTALLEKARQAGCPYAVYWQLYCNEPLVKNPDIRSNKDFKGFWLIRPDGTRSPVCDLFRR